MPNGYFPNTPEGGASLPPNSVRNRSEAHGLHCLMPWSSKNAVFPYVWSDEQACRGPGPSWPPESSQSYTKELSFDATFLAACM